jgi:hypothetical protein
MFGYYSFGNATYYKKNITLKKNSKILLDIKKNINKSIYMVQVKLLLL